MPAERLLQEGLQALAGKPDYDTSLVCYRRSSRDCLVSFGGSCPPGVWTWTPRSASHSATSP